MYAGSVYAGVPYAGFGIEPTNETITLPFIGNVATAFAPFISTTYPNFDPNNWPNEVQVLTVTGTGLTSFTVTFGGETTAPIAADATASEVLIALSALPNIGLGNISVREV